MFYIYIVASIDIENQRKGLVAIVWTGQNQLAAPADWDSVRIFSKINEGSPIRMCSMHFCMPDKQIFYLLRSMYALTHHLSHTRLRFHVGTIICALTLVRIISLFKNI